MNPSKDIAGSEPTAEKPERKIVEQGKHWVIYDNGVKFFYCAAITKIGVPSEQ